MKLCPSCAEDIQDAAVICKHCGRDIKHTAHIATSREVGRRPSIETSVTPAGRVFVAVTVGVVLIATLLAFMNARTRSTRTAAPSATAAKTSAAPVSIEQKLATVDCSCPVAEGDARAQRFRSLVDQLSAKWYEEAQRVADISVAARNSLREKGVSESLVNIMDGLNRAPNTPFANFEYAEHVAMYVTLRKGGDGHDAAVRGLWKALLAQAGREGRPKK